MKQRTWMILGATSIIAEEFARLAAQAGHSLILVARNPEQLAILAADFQVRYRIACETLVVDFAKDLFEIQQLLQQKVEEIDLFVAYSAIFENKNLTSEKIDELIAINIQNTVQLINAYVKRPQSDHRIVFLSSVAACRGRAKNSLYGGSKALIELYLEGLQQAFEDKLQITMVRLGFIDTVQTFGEEGIFYASPPKSCAMACWKAFHNKKRRIYHPFFWRYIMTVIQYLPYFIYKKLGKL